MRDWKGEERLRGEKKMEVEREIGGERREWSGESKMEGERYIGGREKRRREWLGEEGLEQRSEKGG